MILYPYLFSYSIALILTGVAGAFVSREVRGFVHNAADEAIAREAGPPPIGIRRARSLDRPRHPARLLPSTTPSLPGYDIAGVNFPADQTGGDYYDWQKLPDGRLGVALADATGHGIGPRSSWPSVAPTPAPRRRWSPSSAPLLERLNALVCADVSGGRFITFVIAVADGASPRLELLSAGHGPLLLYRAADRSIEQMSGNGLPLGILPDQAYGPPRTIDMQVGDILLLLTDGYFEAQRPGDGDAFGIPRLEEVLRARASEDSASLLGHIDTAVRAFNGRWSPGRRHDRRRDQVRRVLRAPRWTAGVFPPLLPGPICLSIAGGRRAECTAARNGCTTIRHRGDWRTTMKFSRWSGVLAMVAAAGVASWTLVDSSPAYGQPVKVPKKDKDKDKKDKSKKGIKVGDSAPEWTATGVDGKQHKLSEYKGKIVLMDFWATWCGPCKMAMPGVQKIHEAYKDKGVVVLGMNCWEKGGDPKAFMESKKYTYGLMLKSDAAAEGYGVSGIPAFFLIGPDGKILMVERGYSEDGDKKISAVIDKHLSEVKAEAPAPEKKDAATAPSSATPAKKDTASPSPASTTPAPAPKKQ